MLIRAFPSILDDTKISVTAYPKDGIVITDGADTDCGFAVKWITNFPVNTEVELRVHAIPKDTTNWTEAYHVCWLVQRKPAYGSVTIAYPTGTKANPTSVLPYFMAYGYVNPTTSTVTALLKKDGTGSPIAGSPVKPPPTGYDWGFAFENLSSGSTYELIVTEQGGGQATSWVVVK
jgi:hypothetical protein